jgi:hypothetical protein
MGYCGSGVLSQRKQFSGIRGSGAQNGDRNAQNGGGNFLVVMGGVDIIIRCVENDGLPVGEAGGAWYGKLKDVCRVELSVNLCEEYLFAPDICIWRYIRYIRFR